MAVDAVSSFVSGLVPSRPPDPAPDQGNDARAVAEASQPAPQPMTGPGPAVPVATVNDPEGSIQRAQTVIESSSAGETPSSADMRRAAEAYRAESNAESDLARQRQAEGVRSTDVLA